MNRVSGFPVITEDLYQKSIVSGSSAFTKKRQRAFRSLIPFLPGGKDGWGDFQLKSHCQYFSIYINY
jgi:hypothetical protein